jgi:UDP-glucuronate 4-epimerase
MEHMIERHYLVTGGAGFIGSHVVDHLLATGARVTAFDNFDPFYPESIKRSNISRQLANPRYRLVVADLRDRSAIESLFSGERFEVVIHLAAKAGVRPSVTNPHEYQEVNIGGTVNLLEASRKHGVSQLIFASSSSIYGPAATAPFSEEAPLLPISPYAATKAAGELICHTYSHLYGMRIVCLRFFTVYGARQRPDLAIHKFARLMAEGSPLHVYGDGSAERDFTYIDDILQGVLAAIEYRRSPFEVINLGESRTITINRMIGLLEDALGVKAIVEYHPPQAGDMPLTYANISKAQRLLGYNPTTPIESGIGKFIEWFRQE